MKKIICFSLFLFSSTIVISQNNENNWSFGVGINNFTMLGDLKSESNTTYNSSINIGYYTYISKMLTNSFGLEFKIRYSKISGGRDYNSNYDILYIPNHNSLNYIFFEGKSRGLELNTVLDLIKLFNFSLHKFKLKSYIGIGYHTYYSTVYNLPINGSKVFLLDYRDNPQREATGTEYNNDNNYNLDSYYTSFQLAIKYYIAESLSLELRPNLNINVKDELDGAFSNRNKSELFFITNFGIAFDF